MTFKKLTKLHPEFILFNNLPLAPHNVPFFQLKVCGYLFELTVLCAWLLQNFNFVIVIVRLMLFVFVLYSHFDESYFRKVEYTKESLLHVSELPRLHCMFSTFPTVTAFLFRKQFLKRAKNFIFKYNLLFFFYLTAQSHIYCKNFPLDNFLLLN